MTETVWVCTKGCGEFYITCRTTLETEGTFTGYNYCPVCGEPMRCEFRDRV